MKPRLPLALSLGGYAFAALLLAVAAPILGWTGDVGRLWDPVGDAFRAGQPVYVARDYAPFLYAPPWAVVFGLTSLLPVGLQVALVWALNIAGLRYMAGSWQRVGYVLWFPLVAFSLLGATFNLAMAAVIVAAVRGSTAFPVLFAFAKASPILAVDPRKWRGVLVSAVVLVAITLPWLSLWPQWIAQLVGNHADVIAIGVPLAVRLPIAVALLLLRRPWARALAAVVAIPAFYPESFVVLLAPLCVWLGRVDLLDREPADRIGPEYRRGSRRETAPLEVEGVGAG